MVSHKDYQTQFYKQVNEREREQGRRNDFDIGGESKGKAREGFSPLVGAGGRGAGGPPPGKF